MSKIKKKSSQRPTSISEDVKFIKMIQFAGWFFLLALLGYMFVWGVLDWALNLDEVLGWDFVSIEMDAVTFAFIVYTGTSSALCFGLATKTNNNKEQKKEFFLDWLVGEFLFSIFAIFSISVYVWG